MHNTTFLVGFQSDQLTNLIHFVNKSGLLKVKENLCTFHVISNVTALFVFIKSTKLNLPYLQRLFTLKM